MPCIFCIAVFIGLAGVVGAGVIDELERRLSQEATTPIEKTADSESMTKLEFDYPLPDGLKTKRGKSSVPVAMTVYKKTKRVRIQVMTHDVDHETSRKLQERICYVAGLEPESFSDPESEDHVHDAMDEHEHPIEDEKDEKEKEKRREQQRRDS